MGMRNLSKMEKSSFSLRAAGVFGTIPGGTVGYPAQPGLICFSVRNSVCE